MRNGVAFVVILFLIIFSQPGSCFEYSGFLRNRLIKNEINNDSILNPTNQLGLLDNSLENTSRLILKQISDNARIIFDVEGNKNLLNDSENYNIMVNESYYSFSLPKINLLAGKKKIDWGTGFAWNPSDQINPTKNPLDIYESREGSNLLKLDLNLFDSDISCIYQLSSSKGNSRLHLKVGGKIQGFDIASYYSQKSNRKKTAGFMGSGYLTDNWEFHFETATQRGQDQLLPSYNPISGIYSYTANPGDSLLTSYLFGLRYSLSEKNFYMILEYFRNSQGYSGQEGQTYFDYLNAIEQKSAKSTLDNYYIAQSLEIGSKNFQDQYAFVSVKKSNDLNTFEYGFDSLFCLSDGSGVIIPEAKIVLIENIETQLRLLQFWGSDHSEYGNSPMKNEVVFDCVYYF